MLCAYIASMRTSAIFMMDERRDSKGGRKKRRRKWVLRLSGRTSPRQGRKNNAFVDSGSRLGSITAVARNSKEGVSQGWHSFGDNLGHL